MRITNHAVIIPLATLFTINYQGFWHKWVGDLLPKGRVGDSRLSVRKQGTTRCFGETSTTNY